jgi:predicted GH43/DUF377 family glycosyl hydrolase
MKYAVLAACLLLAACGKASFTLPSPGNPAAGHYVWRPLEGLSQPRSDFDSAAAIAPRVFPFGQFLYNLYTAHDGERWITGISASRDGLDWNLGRKALAPDARIWEGGRMAAYGGTLLLDGLIHYWYTAGDPPRIALARSHDGRSWRREQEPVLGPGAADGWDGHATAYPALLEAGGAYYMYYVGFDAAGRARLGLARSSDGVSWTRLRANPLLDLPAPAGAAVWRAQGAYWMLAPLSAGRLTLARSGDGLAWKPLPVEFEGAWPSVLPEEGHARVWYSLDGAFRAGRLEWIPE